MSQQIIVKPLGIITQPNKLGEIPPGAFSDAKGCRIRAVGTLESALAFGRFLNLDTANVEQQFVVELDDTYMLRFHKAPSFSNWFYTIINIGTGVALAGPTGLTDAMTGALQFISTVGRFGCIRMRGRAIVQQANGLAVWDPVPANGTAPRPAGLLPPVLAFRTPTTGNGGVIPQGSYGFTKALIRRKYSDGYEIVSAPSVPSIFYTSVGGGLQDFSYLVFIPLTARAGDTLEVYRTLIQPYVVGQQTNPGDDFYLCATKTITSGDLSVQPTVRIKGDDTTLGEALYTNQGVKGAASASIPPTTAKCCAEYKGYAFYCNRTQPPATTLRAIGIWGAVNGTAFAPTEDPAVRTTCVGTRYLNGTTVLGSPNITGVAAGDMVGIVVGQQYSNYSSVYFSSGSKVINASGTTITMNTNAILSSGGPDIIGMIDVIELNGSAIQAATVDSFELFASTLGFDIVCASVVVDANGNRSGAFTVTRLISNNANDSSFTIRATNGQNWIPALPRLELAETASTISPISTPNGIQWSEENQPENCPVLNTAFVGKGEIYDVQSTRDALFFSCSDGEYRLSGTGGSSASGFDWRIDPVDRTLVVAGPWASCVMKDVVYRYTNRGLVSIDSTGTVSELSTGRLTDRIPGSAWTGASTWSNSTALFLVPDEVNSEVFCKLDGGSLRWIYNANTDTFVCDDSIPGIHHGMFSRARRAIVFSSIEPTNSGRINVYNPGVSQNIDVTYQPIFSDNPFSVRHWRTVNVAMEVSDATVGHEPSVAITTGTTLAGTRTVSASSDGSVFTRTGFTVPRNAPAIANNLKLRLVVTCANQNVPVELQGLEIVYKDHTNQRKVR